MNSPLPRWLLERLMLQELPKPLPEDTRRRLAAAPDTRSDQAALKAEDEAFLREHPPEVMVRRIQARAEQTAPRKENGWALPALGLAAVAALVMVVALPPAEDTHLKGLQPSLLVFRRTSKGPEALANGAQVKPGDVVQLRYRAAGHPFGVIVSVDGSENVTLHVPVQPDARAELVPSGETTVEKGYQLDAAPKFERFLFVTSDHALNPTEVVQATQVWAKNGFLASGPQLPQGTQVTSLTLLKEAK